MSGRACHPRDISVLSAVELEATDRRAKRTNADVAAGSSKRPVVLDCYFTIPGIGEECAYRGVAYTLLYWIFDSAVVGLIISIVAFALMHSHQGWYGAVWAGALGWIFQLMVFATGTLYLAIAVHAMYDVLIGVMFLRLLNNENMTGTRLGEMERTPPS